MDDGSKDGTAEWPSQALAGGRGRVLGLAENRGKGNAVRRGVLAAEGRWVLITDADLSTPIEEHAKLAAAMRATATSTWPSARARCTAHA